MPDLRMVPLLLLAAFGQQNTSQGTCGSTAGSLFVQLRPSLNRMQSEADYTSVAKQRHMQGAEAGNKASTATECPHLRNDLKDFSQLISSSGEDVTLPSGSYLLSAPVTIGSLTVPFGSELIFDDSENLMMSTSGVWVQGTLRMGSPTCPLKSSGIGITFTGAGDFEGPKASDPRGSKGLGVDNGGVAEIFGIRYAPSWTRLASSAEPGAQEIQLMQEVDWEVGQEIAIMTTSWNDELEDHENEVRRISYVAGHKLRLDRPLEKGHYGGQEYSAEVALLTRSVTLQGDLGSEGSRYGGHSICTAGSECRFGGVAAVRMGQENVMGRYPFHFHLMGDVAGGSYFEDCLVYKSYFRAYTLHGTSNSRVSRCAAFNVSGSAYYLEDGVEEGNLFEFDLAAHIHIIDKLIDYEAGGGQKGVTVHTQSSRLVPTDATAVGFYCTNAHNRWVGNSASGGFSGFHFPTVPRALGLSYAANRDYEPDSQELLEFDSNTAHSSGRIWSRGSCIYVGGQLWEETKGSGDLSYQTGRSTARKSGRFLFTNTKVFACRQGTLFWGAKWNAGKPDFMLEAFEAHDVWRSSSQLGETYIVGAVISAHTGNIFAKDLPQVSEGFELYDTDMQTILADVTFRNFDRPGDVCIMDMTHSNIYKPQGMFHSKGLRFIGTPFQQRFRHVYRLAWKTFHQDSGFVLPMAIAQWSVCTF
eukprot:TRINITY_DN3197_c0_g1_i2.p1 TRINITY_DN3197_c0_g1~~TRINITY_DN3197_c0_g1_i2.p1  ORF type:complete len:713 (+),score=117.08 TRINITY_DN3197_c0_g1_i2:46-2139(+)